MFTVENQNSKTYLVYQLKENDVVDNLTLGMMSNNKISGFLPVLYTQVDKDRFFKFDITSLVPASQIFSGTVNKKWITGIFKSITKALSASEEYMISANSFVQDLDYIFVNVSKFTAELVCLPLQNLKQTTDFGKFFKDIMFCSKFDQNENNDYVAKIISYLNSVTTFLPNDFNKVLSAESEKTNFQETRTYSVPQVKTVSSVPVQNMQTTAVPRAVQASAVNAVPKQQSAVSVAVPKKTKEKKVSGGSQNARQANNITIPNVNKQTQGAVPAADASAGKKMSMFYLLCHYNKKNAEVYRAQKETSAAKKAQKSKQSVQNTVSSGMNIPNAQTVPTQNTAANCSQNMAVNQPAFTDDGTGNTLPQNPQVQSYSAGVSFGETTVLGGESDGETTVLGENGNLDSASAARPFIIRLSNSEKIEINKPVFRIGKEKSYVDYFIGDNSYVSRGHANIMERGGKYLIVDNNSRNHTYVNGEIIGSGLEVELHNGDTFKLGNEAFEFKLF